MPLRGFLVAANASERGGVFHLRIAAAQGERLLDRGVAVPRRRRARSRLETAPACLATSRAGGPRRRERGRSRRRAPGRRGGRGSARATRVSPVAYTAARRRVSMRTITRVEGESRASVSSTRRARSYVARGAFQPGVLAPGQRHLRADVEGEADEGRPRLDRREERERRPPGPRPRSPCVASALTSRAVVPPPGGRRD